MKKPMRTAVVYLMLLSALSFFFYSIGYVAFADNGPDEVYGTEGDDVLAGGHGPDVLYGYKGNDRLWGGKGPDTFFCGGGYDVVHNKKDTGNDRIGPGCELVKTS